MHTRLTLFKATLVQDKRPQRIVPNSATDALWGLVLFASKRRNSAFCTRPRMRTAIGSSKKRKGIYPLGSTRTGDRTFLC